MSINVKESKFLLRISNIVNTRKNISPEEIKKNKEIKIEEKRIEKEKRKVEAHKREQCNKFYRDWVEVMGYMGLGNEKSQTYALRDLEYEDFGFTCKIYTPLGMNLAALQTESTVETIQDNLGCLFVADKVPKSKYMKAKFIMRDTKFENYNPIKLEPYEILLGQNIDSTPMKSNMLKYPHVIIQGSTNMGKSKFIDTILTNLIVTTKEEDLSLYIIQADKSDQYVYSGCKHCKGYTDTHEDSLKMLTKLILEIEKRNDKMKEYIYNGICSNISEYNQAIANKKLKSKKWNYIYLVVDEYASLMPESSFGKQKIIKQSIQAIMERLIQIGRFVGLYVILSTQRATVDKLPSFVKANCCTIVTFKVNNRKSSEIAIDSNEAVGLKQREFITKIESMSFGQTYNLTQQDIVNHIKPFRLSAPKKFDFSDIDISEIIPSEDRNKTNNGSAKRKTKSERKSTKKQAMEDIMKNLEKKKQDEIKDIAKTIIGNISAKNTQENDIENLIKNPQKKKEKLKIE